jgi:protein-tyrosine phosphatase
VTAAPTSGPASPEARTVHVPDVRNIRDLGGLEAERGPERVPIRSGLILRGAALHALTAQGADVLADLGLRTVIDLRVASERALEPSRVGEYARLAQVRQLWLPLVDDFEGSPDTPDGSYRFMIERGAKAIGTVLAALAEPGALPAYVHCAAGKDRTGVIVATLLRTLGVPMRQVYADFMRSNETLGERLIYPAHTWALDAALELMAELGDGSIEGFLGRQGVSADALAALHATLLGTAAG